MEKERAENATKLNSHMEEAADRMEEEQNSGPMNKPVSRGRNGWLRLNLTESTVSFLLGAPSMSKFAHAVEA